MNSYSFMPWEFQWSRTHMLCKPLELTCNGQWKTEWPSKSCSMLLSQHSSWCHIAYMPSTKSRNQRMLCWTSLSWGLKTQSTWTLYGLPSSSSWNTSNWSYSCSCSTTEWRTWTVSRILLTWVSSLSTQLMRQSTEVRVKYSSFLLPLSSLVSMLSVFTGISLPRMISSWTKLDGWISSHKTIQTATHGRLKATSQCTSELHQTWLIGWSLFWWNCFMKSTQCIKIRKKLTYFKNTAPIRWKISMEKLITTG